MNHGKDSNFALGTFSLAGCPPFAGLVLEGERVIAVEALHGICAEAAQWLPPGRTTLELLDQWPVAEQALRHAAAALKRAETASARQTAQKALPMASLRVHAPVASRQIFLSGANYFRHVVDIIVDLGAGKTPGTEGMSAAELRAHAEALMTRRKHSGTPYVFSKPVSVLSGPFDPIVLPAFAQQPDWELELVAVIGAPARYVSRTEAMNFVAGYTIANDITNRDWIWTRGDMKAMGTDWLLAKSCPTYLPVGPYIVPAAQIDDPQQLQVQLKLNGRTMQDDSTSDMIFDVARLVEHVSSIVQLLPGDLICTGSPAGNGTHYDRYLQPGDIVEGSITGLGMQRTPVIAEPR